LIPFNVFDMVAFGVGSGKHSSGAIFGVFTIGTCTGVTVWVTDMWYMIGRTAGHTRIGIRIRILQQLH
jgi:hypothetical protein